VGLVALLGLLCLASLAFGSFACARSTEPSGTATGLAGTWSSKEPPAIAPSPRAFQSMVYVPSIGRVIMFGGSHTDSSSAPTTDMNDTWAYDPNGNTWRELDPSGAVPSPRSLQSMVYDSKRDKVILFGGGADSPGWEPAGSSGELNDLWQYDPATNQWTELKPSGPLPPGGQLQSMVYDPISARVLLFGGEVEMASGQGSGPTYPNDLWAYDPAANTWTKVEPTGNRPAGRAGQVMVFDTDTSQVIMCGGVSFGLEPSIFTDPWTYDPVDNSWTELKWKGRAPNLGWAPCMIYHEEASRCFAFSGSIAKSGESSSGTWSFDPVDPRWTRLADSDGSPPARSGASMVYLPGVQEVMLYGGQRPETATGSPQEFTYYDDVWVWSDGL
jgi:N-acetylneuraminic acid mutarotase